MKNRKLQTQTLKTKVLLVIAAVCIPVLILFFGILEFFFNPENSESDLWK